LPVLTPRRLLLSLVLATTISLPAQTPDSQAGTRVAGVSSSLLDKAKAFLGTPYRYGGRSPKGFDCSGFVSFVFDSFGVALPRSSVHQAKQGESIDLDEIQPGDLLFFKTRGKQNRISHVGIYMGDGQFIHAGSWGSRKGRCVKVSELDGDYYVKRLVSARRVLGPASAFLEVPQQMLHPDASLQSRERAEP